jgi:hypothetical protein
MFIARDAHIKIKLRRSGMSMSPLTGLRKKSWGRRRYKHVVPRGLLNAVSTDIAIASFTSRFTICD